MGDMWAVCMLHTICTRNDQAKLVVIFEQHEKLIVYHFVWNNVCFNMFNLFHSELYLYRFFFKLEHNYIYEPEE